jgi:hypothetical protein
LIGALALAGAAFAQVPSSNDTSDTNQNTGMGTGALGGPSPTNLTGNANTASGTGALGANTSGSRNTGSGSYVLENNTTGSANSAFGMDALQDNTTGSDNTASGVYALEDNTSGSGNTASGAFALEDNTTGVGNTASGEFALEDNLSGRDNTANGYSALVNSVGSYNTASGAFALMSNTTANYNTASGYSALYSNTTADYNTAAGFGALYGTTTGNSNTASGYEALYANTSGTDNTASGVHALASNTTGSNNIAEGWHGGYNLTTGSNNIDIGSPGVAAESGVIRIGTITGTTSTQSATYVAGIYGVKTATAGMAVVIDSSGQLGTVSSSIRYKEDVEPMASVSERLLKLRPVTFRYKKADASGEKPIQYGLIAEEVANVYPELVVRDATTGRIDGVRYDELAPMLLNEVQQQQGKNVTQDHQIAAQAAEIQELKHEVSELKTLNQATQVALQKLQASPAFVAER